MSKLDTLKLVFPKNGQIIIEDVQDLVLCKPRLIPLKSFTLEKLEKMQQEAKETAQESVEQNIEEEN